MAAMASSMPPIPQPGAAATVATPVTAAQPATSAQHSAQQPRQPNGTAAAATPANQAQPSILDSVPDAFANHSGSPALQQMSHLAVYLQDCDDEARKAEMIQCLQALPHQTLMHAAQNLKKRAFWLNAEEACEFERASELKVLMQPMESSDQTSAETPSK